MTPSRAKSPSPAGAGRKKISLAPADKLKREVQAALTDLQRVMIYRAFLALPSGVLQRMGALMHAPALTGAVNG